MIAALVLAALPAAPQSPASRLAVSVERGLEGTPRATVQVENVPVDLLLEALAAHLSRLEPGEDWVVDGFDLEGRAALVTVDLRDRPLPFVLDAALGSVGLRYELRPGSIRVREASTEELATEDLRAEAMLAYAAATRRFPAHPAAPAARLEQGELEEQRGNLSAALAHYESVRDVYRDSELVPESIWRTGLVLEQMGNWSEANLTLRALANLEGGADYHARARLEMARCATELGDPYRATHVLEALEETHPVQDHEERVARRLVAARALVESGRSMQALRSLDEIVTGKLTDEQRGEIFSIQARAFEDVGLPREAAWAWQVYSRQTTGVARVAALENAARLSLQTGEELNVLFLEKLAEEDGAGERLAPYVEEAKRRIGMTPGVPVRETSPVETARRASQRLESGDVAGASQLLEPLFARRSELPPEQAVTVVTLWARVLERRRGLDAALRMLRSTRSELDDIELRSRLDVCAADLFEEYELFEQAVRAYEGQY